MSRVALPNRNSRSLAWPKPSHYKEVGLETLGVEQELIPDFILLSLWGIKTCVDSPAFQIATNLWAGLSAAETLYRRSKR